MALAEENSKINCVLRGKGGEVVKVSLPIDKKLLNKTVKLHVFVWKLIAVEWSIEAFNEIAD